MGPCLPFGSHPTPVCSPVLRAAPLGPPGSCVASCPAWGRELLHPCGSWPVRSVSQDHGLEPQVVDGVAVAVCGLGTLHGISSTLSMTESVQSFHAPGYATGRKSSTWGLRVFTPFLLPSKKRRADPVLSHKQRGAWLCFTSLYNLLSIFSFVARALGGVSLEAGP